MKPTKRGSRSLKALYLEPYSPTAPLVDNPQLALGFEPDVDFSLTIDWVQELSYLISACLIKNLCPSSPE